MKTALFVFGFLGAGLIGAVAARELFPPAAPVADAPSGLAGLEARVNDLSAQVARLTEEVRVRGDAEVVPNTPSPFEAADAPEAVPGAAPEHDSAVPALLTDEKIERKVEETIAKIARERAEEKARRTEIETRKKEREWLLTKQKELGMTDYQVEEFAKLLIYRRVRLAGLKAGWNEATPEQQAQRKTEMEDLGREMRGELQKLLSGDQYEAIMKTNGRK